MADTAKVHVVGAALRTALARRERPPLELIPERVLRATVVEVLAPCLGELEDRLEAKKASARMRCTPRCSIGLASTTEVLGTLEIKHKSGDIVTASFQSACRVEQPQQQQEWTQQDPTNQRDWLPREIGKLHGLSCY